jgi:hypothetical protein
MPAQRLKTFLAIHRAMSERQHLPGCFVLLNKVAEAIWKLACSACGGEMKLNLMAANK